MKSFQCFLMPDLVNCKSGPQEEVHGKWVTNQLIKQVLISSIVQPAKSVRHPSISKEYVYIDLVSLNPAPTKLMVSSNASHCTITQLPK